MIIMEKARLKIIRNIGEIPRTKKLPSYGINVSKSVGRRKLKTKETRQTTMFEHQKSSGNRITDLEKLTHHPAVIVQMKAIRELGRIKSSRATKILVDKIIYDDDLRYESAKVLKRTHGEKHFREKLVAKFKKSSRQDKLKIADAMVMTDKLSKSMIAELKKIRDTGNKSQKDEAIAILKFNKSYRNFIKNG